MSSIIVKLIKMEDKSNKAAAGMGAGAVLGALVAGPVGALVGGLIGWGVGVSSSENDKPRDS
jgi:predicted MFS family arabinose efflux permease